MTDQSRSSPTIPAGRPPTSRSANGSPRYCSAFAIHHIGSTAVPGLAGKAVIDMIALVDDLDASSAAVMQRAGYALPAPFNVELVHRRFLSYPTAAYRTHHLHLVDEREDMERCLRFRDSLRTDPKLAADYVALKRALAVRFREDRMGYTKAKSQFINDAPCRTGSWRSRPSASTSRALGRRREARNGPASRPRGLRWPSAPPASVTCTARRTPPAGGRVHRDELPFSIATVAFHRYRESLRDHGFRSPEDHSAVLVSVR